MNQTIDCYHVTTTYAWEHHIQQEGLRPAIGERATEYGETTPRVYLFPNIEAYEDAMLQWLGELFDDDEPLVLLKVSLPLAVFADYIEQDVAYEIAVTQPIPPMHLSFVTHVA